MVNGRKILFKLFSRIPDFWQKIGCISGQLSIQCNHRIYRKGLKYSGFWVINFRVPEIIVKSVLDWCMHCLLTSFAQHCSVNSL